MDETKDLSVLKELGLPGTFFQSYDEQLNFYKEQRETITKYISENLKEGIDYGYTIGEEQNQNRKKTLMKSGAEKITAYMNCRIRFYPDHSSWQMMGSKDAICFTAYLVDEKVLQLITMAIIRIGIEHEERIVKLFAWGEGRGAYEIDEKVYSSKWGKDLAGKPLRGTYNRGVKMAEKRAETDLIIRVFGLDFAQDSDLKTLDKNRIYSIAMHFLNKSNIPADKKPEYKIKIDTAKDPEEIEKIIDEMKSYGTIQDEKKDFLELKTNKTGVDLLNEVMVFVNQEHDQQKKMEMMKEVIAVKQDEEELKKLFSKYKGEMG